MEVATTTTSRLAWIDATRGYSVVAVVLFHVILWGYSNAGHPVAEAGRSVWGLVNSVLGSVRMPILLAVSGLVLARYIRSGPLRGGMLIRSSRNYYLYTTWLVIYAVFYVAFPQRYLHHRVDGVQEVLMQLVVPATTLWYLLALAVYSLVLTAVRRWPPWLVLTLLALVSSVVHAHTFPGHLWPKVPELFVFYAMGVYGAGALRRQAERATLLRLAAAFLVALAVTGVGRFTEGRPVDAFLFVPRGAAFLLLAVLAVAIAVRWSPLRTLGVALGQQTLGIYVLHPLWISLLTILVTGPGRDLFTEVLAHPVTAVAYPAVVTVVIVAACMSARRSAERLRVGWLFALPASWESLSTRVAGRWDQAGPAHPRRWTRPRPSIGGLTPQTSGAEPDGSAGRPGKVGA